MAMTGPRRRWGGGVSLPPRPDRASTVRRKGDRPSWVHSREGAGGRRHCARDETMAATIWIEMDSGTGCSPVHPHNGYWAGDFSVASGDARPDDSPYRAPRPRDVRPPSVAPPWVSPTTPRGDLSMREASRGHGEYGARRTPMQVGPQAAPTCPATAA